MLGPVEAPKGFLGEGGVLNATIISMEPHMQKPPQISMQSKENQGACYTKVALNGAPLATLWAAGHP